MKKLNTYMKPFERYVDSNAQIKLIVAGGIKLDIKYLHRLIVICMKKLDTTFHSKVYELITSRKSDSYIYKELIKFHQQKIPHLKTSTMVCSRDESLGDELIYHLEQIRPIKTISRYLDFGCGKHNYQVNIILS